jgi:type I restriction enzyme M protein
VKRRTRWCASTKNWPTRPSRRQARWGRPQTKALKTHWRPARSEKRQPRRHIHWPGTFPRAIQDVTGLCKLATLAEVAEQDFSLNPGRYVGVVIEEDGKTEEEFVAELLAMNEELTRLNEDARELEAVIAENIRQVAGEQ